MSLSYQISHLLSFSLVEHICGLFKTPWDNVSAFFNGTDSGCIHALRMQFIHPRSHSQGILSWGPEGKEGCLFTILANGFYFGFVSLSMSNDIVGILSNQDLPSCFGKESILRLSHQNR